MLYVAGRYWCRWCWSWAKLPAVANVEDGRLDRDTRDRGDAYQIGPVLSLLLSDHNSFQTPTNPSYTDLPGVLHKHGNASSSPMHHFFRN